MNTLPKFYIGQRVVAIEDHSWGLVKKGQEFTVIEIQKHCCFWAVYVGMYNSWGGMQCCICRSRSYTDKIWFEQELFAPIEEIKDFRAITYEKVLETEFSSVN